MLFSRIMIALIAVVACPCVLNAHPGHGTDNGNSIRHFATSPLHMLPVFGVAVLFTVLSLLLSLRQRQSKMNAVG